MKSIIYILFALLIILNSVNAEEKTLANSCVCENEDLVPYNADISGLTRLCSKTCDNYSVSCYGVLNEEDPYASKLSFCRKESIYQAHNYVDSKYNKEARDKFIRRYNIFLYSILLICFILLLIVIKKNKTPGIDIDNNYIPLMNNPSHNNEDGDNNDLPEYRRTDENPSIQNRNKNKLPTYEETISNSN